MPRIMLSELRDLPDAIPADGFKLLLGAVPGAGDSYNLTLKCQTAVIPGFSNESWDLALAAHVMRYRGRKMYPRTLAVAYVEDATFETTRILRGWHEVIVGSDTGEGAVKLGGNGYSLDTAWLHVLNQQGETIDEMVFYGFFIQDVADVALDGTSTTGPMLVNATFSYDRFYSAYNIGTDMEKT